MRTSTEEKSLTGTERMWTKTQGMTEKQGPFPGAG
jgi:hypothetical protein